jgi:hypothetical protein
MPGGRWRRTNGERSSKNSLVTLLLVCVTSPASPDDRIIAVNSAEAFDFLTWFEYPPEASDLLELVILANNARSLHGRPRIDGLKEAVQMRIRGQWIVRSLRPGRWSAQQALTKTSAGGGSNRATRKPVGTEWRTKCRSAPLPARGDRPLRRKTIV